MPSLLLRTEWRAVIAPPQNVYSLQSVVVASCDGRRGADGSLNRVGWLQDTDRLLERR